LARRPWVRGALTLVLIGGLAAGLVAAPVGAAQNVTRAKARQIAKKVFNKNIGGAPFLPTGSVTVQAQDDSTADYVDNATGTVTVNTVNITAPTAGFIIISGQVTLDNDDAASHFAVLDVSIDGTDATPNGKAAAAELDEDSNLIDEATLAYTITRAVSAGAHTVAQRAQCCTAFDYDGNELTVQFVPSGAVARTGARGSEVTGSDRGGDT
jgi:hypothetical protein